MFNNVAPVAPEPALQALERPLLGPEADQHLPKGREYLPLLRSIAYDASLFARCARLILKMAEVGDVEDKSNEALNVFQSLFLLCLSGTHATIEQRLGVIEPLLASDDLKRRRIAVTALEAALEAWHFLAFGGFEFGARSRDYGYWPRTQDEVKHWFASVLKCTQSLACSEAPLASELRAVIADQFRGLWIKAGIYDELEQVCAAIRADRFWRDGWIAVRETLHFDEKVLSPEALHRLRSLA
jgi:hypothetical protein